MVDLSGSSEFRPPHEEAIPTAELARDYLHLASLTTEHPEATYHVRYRVAGATSYGVLEGATIHQLSGDPFGDPTRTGRTHPLEEVRLLAPLDPNRVSKVLGVAANTRDAQLTSVPFDSHPRWFSKLPTSITGSGGGVEVPPDAAELVHEAELVIVIGRPGRHLSIEDAGRSIWGVTAGNDLTDFSWIAERGGRTTPGRLLAKAPDTFAPIGPAIAVGLDYRDLPIVHRLNGRVTQSGSSGDRLQDPASLIAYLSRYVTLLPGDIVFTGATPFVDGAERLVRVGDELEVEIGGIGILRNRGVPPA
jgi:2-keto-4-pentenoate hydratase/2-oxohepta-3-ene-1,7-dioic acid hydratase in catechol pathway